MISWRPLQPKQIYDLVEVVNISPQHLKVENIRQSVTYLSSSSRVKKDCHQCLYLKRAAMWRDPWRQQEHLAESEELLAFHQKRNLLQKIKCTSTPLGVTTTVQCRMSKPWYRPGSTIKCLELKTRTLELFTRRWCTSAVSVLSPSGLLQGFATQSFATQPRLDS